MTSFVYIELDTKPPEIQIFSPSYTTTKITNTIRIEANEPLSDYQEIYAIDSNGVRHEYTFNKEEANLLIGEVGFFNFPLGVATIYVRLKDEVENISDSASATIMIRENLTLLNLNIHDNDREVSINNVGYANYVKDHLKKVFVNNYSKSVSISGYEKNIQIIDANRTINITESKRGALDA